MIVYPPLHVAFVYDMLAVLSVKGYRLPSYVNEKNYLELYNYLGGQVGKELHFSILISEEYKTLCRLNGEVFDKIDSIKKNGETFGDATWIDSRNYARFLAKKALQEKFFPDSPLNEQKIGYNK